MKFLLLLLLVTFAKASPIFEGKLVSSIKYLRTFATKTSHVQNFFKLSLQVEIDIKIRLKTKNIGGHRTRFEDKA